jgi:DNA-directed RNA polymerase subunit RPC12/RpoP
MEIKKFPIILFCLLIGLLLAGFTLTQETPYRININKDFGFSSGSRIRGTFTLTIIGELEPVTSVTFLFDGQVMTKVLQKPYQFQFKTQDYSTGSHEITAEVETRNGSTITTPARSFKFVSAEEESAEMQRIVLPLFGGIILLVAVIFGVQWLIFRERPLMSLPYGTSRHYGIFGGTICPKCRRPFSIHWWGLNLGFHKYDRCDYCGHWSIVKRRSGEELAAAEAAEIVEARKQSTAWPIEFERDENDRLDKTRYTDKI